MRPLTFVTLFLAAWVALTYLGAPK